MATKVEIKGYCAPGAEAIARVFADNFIDCGEQGAALSIMRQGELWVNLWAGTRDKEESQLWEESTRVNIFSASKAFVALCVLQLAEQGKLALDAPVAQYWPEFAAGEKGAITLRQVLCHRSGISAFKQPLADRVIYDWQAVTAAVAAQEPWWQPGTAQGYSPVLFGWLLGEVVRRVSGSDSFDAYFQAAVAGPLGLDVVFGVDENELHTVADVGALKVKLPTLGAGELASLMKSDPRGVSNRAFTNPISMMVGTNSTAWRQAQIPAANGQASAMALARFYNALIDVDQGLLSSRNLPWCWQPQSCGEDRVLATYLRFSLGFMLTQAREDCRLGYGERGFGHPGAGGCLGFADPDNDIAFGYVTNRMGQGVLIDERARRLVDITYETLPGAGYV